MQSSVTTRNSPGMIMTHQEFVIRALLARDNMLPQDNSFTGKPSPRKLSVDSIEIQLDTLETITNITAERKFGTR